MRRHVIVLVAACLIGAAYGASVPTNDLDAVLTTVVLDFSVTNMPPQAVISDLSARLQKMDPPRRLPVVIAVRPDWTDNYPAVTFSATHVRVDDILSIISQLSGTKLIIMDGAIVLKEIDHWDWLTYQQSIQEPALGALGLTPKSVESDVTNALARFGIRFTSGCSARLMRTVGLGGASDSLELMLTLEPADAQKVRGIIQLLNEGFTITKPEPQQGGGTLRR